MQDLVKESINFSYWVFKQKAFLQETIKASISLPEVAVRNTSELQEHWSISDSGF